MSGSSSWAWRLNAAFLALGLLALGWMLHRVGPDSLLRGLTHLGWGFALSAGAHFMAIAMDSVTLRACAGQDGARVSLVHVLRASLAGHAINEATPLGRLGEITKFTVLAERLPGERAAAALIVQNIIMFASNCVLMVLAPIIAVLTLDVDPDAATLLMLTAGVFAVLGVLTLVLMYLGPGELPFRLARRLGLGARVERWRERWREIESRWHEAARDRRRMVVAWLSGLASRLASVAEIAIILVFLGSLVPGSQSALIVAALTLASSQIITWLTSFVPLQAGTAEGGAYLLYRSIGLPAGLGVIVELIRKVRRLLFIGIGLSLLGWQTVRQLVKKAGS